MKHYLNTLSVLMVMAVVSGCKEETKSVEYYLNHKLERMEKIKECKNEIKSMENCNNAAAAEFKAGKDIPRF